MLISLLLIAVAPSWECPKTLKTTQSLRDVPSGWQPFIDTTNTRHQLDAVAFYDGSPKDLAALKPDNGDSDEAPVWTFTRSAGRQIWQVCAYSQTAVTLARALPETLKSCRLGKDLAVSCAQ